MGALQKLVELVAACGPFKLSVAKTAITFKGTRRGFAGAKPRRDTLELQHVVRRQRGERQRALHPTPGPLFMFRQREPLTYDRRDIDQQKRLLSEAFEGVGWRVPQLLASALADPGFGFDALSQVRMPSWSSGRVALIGDAAHCASPVAGAGATLCLIGAYRLAGELSAASGDHHLAFRRYEDGHRELIERTQANLFIGLVAPKTHAGIQARNAMARLPLLRVMAGVERRLQPKTEPLPDYERQRNAARA